jgi:hypothetical protein
MLRGKYSFDEAHEEAILETVRMAAVEFLSRGFDIILDEMNIQPHVRILWMMHINGEMGLSGKPPRYICVYFPEQERNYPLRKTDHRGVRGWKKIIQKMKKGFIPPGPKEGFARIITMPLEKAKYGRIQ